MYWSLKLIGEHLDDFTGDMEWASLSQTKYQTSSTEQTTGRFVFSRIYAPKSQRARKAQKSEQTVTDLHWQRYQSSELSSVTNPHLHAFGSCNKTKAGSMSTLVSVPFRVSSCRDYREWGAGVEFWPRKVVRPLALYMTSSVDLHLCNSPKKRLLRTLW